METRGQRSQRYVVQALNGIAKILLCTLDLPAPIGFLQYLHLKKSSRLNAELEVFLDAMNSPMKSLICRFRIILCFSRKIKLIWLVLHHQVVTIGWHHLQILDYISATLLVEAALRNHSSLTRPLTPNNTDVNTITLLSILSDSRQGSSAWEYRWTVLDSYRLFSVWTRFHQVWQSGLIKDCPRHQIPMDHHLCRLLISPNLVLSFPDEELSQRDSTNGHERCQTIGRHCAW